MKSLARFATAKNHLTIAAFDHRNSLFDLLNPQDPSTVSAHQVVELKRQFIDSFADISSAILIDPVYGLDYGIDLTLEVPKSTGIFMSLEESSYDESQQGRLTKLLPNWGVADIQSRNAGAKLLLYYHPNAPIAKQQLKLVEEISHTCRHEKVVFLIEPIIYGIGDYSSKNKLEVTLKTIDQLSPLVDILKLEFPLPFQQSSESEIKSACTQISHHATVPWIILSRGVDYQEFSELTTVCCQEGASGIAVGRAVWQDIKEIALNTTDPVVKLEKISKFLHTTAKKRMQDLCRLVDQFAHPAF